MQLHAPFEISPRLEPALRIGDARLCLRYARRRGQGGRIRYRWSLLRPGQPDATGDDLQSGAFGGTLQDGFRSLLSFLSAAAESYAWVAARGAEHFADPDANECLFPPSVTEWAAANASELDILSCEIEEAAPDSLIVE